MVDVAYASLGVAGTARLLTSPALRTWLGLGGAAVLVAMGARTLVSAWRARLGAETPGEVASLRALRTSLAATASNPLTIGSWAAIFAAASAASVATDTASTVTLLAGVGLGTLGWFTFLSLVLTVVRRRIGERGGLRLADVVAGLGLIGFGGLLDGGRPATGTEPDRRRGGRSRRLQGRLGRSGAGRRAAGVRAGAPAATLCRAARRAGGAAVVGVDMPIGLSDDGWRPRSTPPPGRGCGGQDRACS